MSTRSPAITNHDFESMDPRRWMEEKEFLALPPHSWVKSRGMNGGVPKWLASCAGIAVVAVWAGAAPDPTSRPSPPDLIVQLENEMSAGLARRSVRPQFDQYQKYAIGRLDATAGANTWQDKTGNGRLSWYDAMMRDQLHAPQEVERFSREFHDAILDEKFGLDRALALAAKRLDIETNRGGKTVPVKNATNPREVLMRALAEARRSWDAALAPLSEEEKNDLRANAYDITTKQVMGYSGSGSFPDQVGGRRICNLIEKMNRTALVEAAAALVPLADREFLEHLKAWPRNQHLTVPGVQGEVCEVMETPEGRILVGGTGDNVYDLDALPDVAVVVDLGGNDTYLEGTVSARRPVMILLDLAGNDTYRGEKPGIQGGAVCGISMLVDLAGDDTYEARDVAQGACVAGIGLLIDDAGNDTYRGLRRNQGSAMGGIAMLIDRAGNDSYHSALFAQGFGGPFGFGVLDDLDGADHYYAGGKWKNGYGDTPGYDGWSQGVGVGARGVANGGIGMLLDGGGDDIYECDYFSHGGGYWFAVGIARDFGGNDQRLGSTRLAYDGSERAEKIFLRWGIGWQAHYGIGFTLDDEGNDVYGGNIVGLGFSWDVGVAGLLDFGGNDQYTLTYGAQGQQAALGILFDYGGDDAYGGKDYGGAPAAIAYHPLPDCGGNFAFSINIGGKDTYGGESLNEVDQERGSPGGFFIDREFFLDHKTSSR